LGIITLDSLLEYFSKLTSISGQGGIIVIELRTINDYSLTEISRLIEADGANILSLFTTNVNHTSSIQITIKVDTTDIKPIIATLERFDYKVKAYYQEADVQNLIKDRYDSLMHFLNI
jgi:tyrosine-protein phosphatase YwqE